MCYNGGNELRECEVCSARPKKGDNMSYLFEEVTATATESARTLPGSAMLKSYAIQLASEIMTKVPEGDAEFIQRIKDSQTDHQAMDKLVQDLCGERLVNEAVAAFDPDEVKKLLKSNQSNRSRRKNMAMTQSNYVEMLTAAIAEWTLRESCHIAKSTQPFAGTRVVTFEFTEESLASLVDDQDELARVIRNWASKRSAYKSKHQDQPGWEDAPEYKTICEQLAQLRALRTSQTTRGVSRRGASPKKALQFIFDGVAPTEALSKDDSYAIINACRELAKGNYPAAYLEQVEQENRQKAAEEAAAAEAAAAEIDVMSE